MVGRTHELHDERRLRIYQTEPGIIDEAVLCCRCKHRLCHNQVPKDSSIIRGRSCYKEFEVSWKLLEVNSKYGYKRK